MFSHSEVYLWVASRIWEVPPDWRAIRTQPVKSKAGCVVYMEKIPFSPPDITQAEIDEVVDTLRSGWITTGPKSKQFEREIAAYCGTDTAVCLNSATASLELTLRVLGIGPGDEVIVPAYTYTATASPVCHVGATLVMVDSQPDCYEMDYAQLEKAITPAHQGHHPGGCGGDPV